MGMECLTTRQTNRCNKVVGQAISYFWQEVFQGTLLCILAGCFAMSMGINDVVQ